MVLWLSEGHWGPILRMNLNDEEVVKAHVLSSALVFKILRGVNSCSITSYLFLNTCPNMPI